MESFLTTTWSLYDIKEENVLRHVFSDWLVTVTVYHSQLWWLPLAGLTAFPSLWQNTEFSGSRFDEMWRPVKRFPSSKQTIYSLHGRHHRHYIRHCDIWMRRIFCGFSFFSARWYLILLLLRVNAAFILNPLKPAASVSPSLSNCRFYYVWRLMDLSSEMIICRWKLCRDEVHDSSSRYHYRSFPQHIKPHHSAVKPKFLLLKLTF